MHDSGAERALVADLAHELGVEFADLAPETLTTIGGMLDDGLAATNPLDVWGTGADTRNLFGACLRAMVDDPAVAVTALAVDLVTEFDGDTAYADAVTDVAKLTDAPIAVMASVASAIDPTTAERLRDSGIPVLEGARSGLAALDHLARWPLPVDQIRRRGAIGQAAAMGVADCAPGSRRSSCWLTTACRSSTSDPPTPSPRCSQAADAVGYPVALKTVAALHKSDVGGVALTSARRDSAAGSVRGDGRLARARGDRRADGRGRRRGLGRDRARSGLRPVADRRGGRHPGRVARRQGGGLPAGVARGRPQPARRPAYPAAAGRVARSTRGRHRRARTR